MSEERLRRLDALFAEKVLGLRVEPGLSGGVYEIAEHHDAARNESYMQTMKPLRSFTRSLDAAWEGAMHVIHLQVGSPEIAMSGVRFDGGGEAFLATCCNKPASATHPAEALVLACLRAVGCTEEELK